MRPRTAGLALSAGLAAFLLAFVGVAELLAPHVEFSVLVGIPVGLAVGTGVAAFVLRRSDAEETRHRALAAGLAAFGAAFLLAFVAGLFVLGQGATASIAAASVSGVLGGIAAFASESIGPPRADAADPEKR